MISYDAGVWFMPFVGSVGCRCQTPVYYQCIQSMLHTIIQHVHALFRTYITGLDQAVGSNHTRDAVTVKPAIIGWKTASTPLKEPLTGTGTCQACTPQPQQLATHWAGAHCSTHWGQRQQRQQLADGKMCCHLQAIQGQQVPKLKPVRLTGQWPRHLSSASEGVISFPDLLLLYSTQQSNLRAIVHYTSLSLSTRTRVRRDKSASWAAA